MFSLQGKIAVVTGGASGIGEATARRFAEAGAKVAIGDLRDASATAKEIGGLAVRTDVSREAEVEHLLEYGKVARSRFYAFCVWLNWLHRELELVGDCSKGPPLEAAICGWAFEAGDELATGLGIETGHVRLG